MRRSTDEYRTALISAEQKAQEDFDKTVLALSGGALGISFAFIKDIIGSKPVTNWDFLLLAWICWGISVTSVLASYYFSHLALRFAISQVDKGDIYKKHPGGLYDILTGTLNALGGILFLLGVILAVIFVRQNVGA